MRFSLITAAVLSAMSVAPVQAAGCNLGASKAWMPFKGQAYGSEAYANGSSCAAAVVTIVLRARGGQVLWVDAMPTAQLMTFAEAKTPKQMQAGLVDWLTQQHMFKSSADLPEWKKGAEGPVAGEFPFYPEAGVDRETYTQIRGEKQAMFCYVQGMESMACVAIAKDGTATKVGVHLFPG